MKKILTLLCVALLGFAAANAQAYKGKPAVGAFIGYGSLNKNVALGIRAQYGIIDHLRIEASFTSFFKKKVNIEGIKLSRSVYDLNINVHYLFGVYDDKLFLYPLAGMSYTMSNLDGIDNNHLGLNLGAGAEYSINDHWAANLEYRHTIIKDIDQSVVTAGVNYKF